MLKKKDKKNNSKKKIISNLTIFILIVVSLFYITYSVSSIDNKQIFENPKKEDLSKNTLYQFIYNPFNMLIVKDRDVEIKQVDTQSPVVKVGIKFIDFEHYGKNVQKNLHKPYCHIGGDYKTRIYVKPSHGREYSNYTTLFHCKTTKELYQLLKIPSSWNNDHLLIYCNNGNKINIFEYNIDFLTTQLNLYKVCIVKNLDLNDNNTIVYGLEVGNSKVDSDKNYFFDTDENTDILTNLNRINPDEKNPYVYEDKNKKKYYLYYDKDNSMYTFIVGNNLNLDSNINIDNNFIEDIFSISRILLINKMKNNKIILGYEIPLNQILTEKFDYIDPVYIIKFSPNLAFTENFCKKTLAKYKPSSLPISETTFIKCSDNKLFINSHKNGLGKKEALNLFKNIILDFNTN